MPWPKRCQPVHAQRGALSEASATRSGAHNMLWVGVRSTRAHTHCWLTGSGSSGGARHERLLREAPGWRGACRPVLHGSWPLRKRRDSPAVCVTQRYVKSAAGRLTPGQVTHSALRSRALTDSFLLPDRGAIRQRGAVRVRSPGGSAQRCGVGLNGAAVKPRHPRDRGGVRACRPDASPRGSSPACRCSRGCRSGSWPGRRGPAFPG
jgi:hypothetical protein